MKIHQNWGIYRSSTGISFVAFFNHIVWGWQVTTSSPRCWLVDCQSWFRRQALSAMWCSPLVGGPMGSFFFVIFSSGNPQKSHQKWTILGGKIHRESRGGPEKRMPRGRSSTWNDARGWSWIYPKPWADTLPSMMWHSWHQNFMLGIACKLSGTRLGNSERICPFLQGGVHWCLLVSVHPSN